MTDTLKPSRTVRYLAWAVVIILLGFAGVTLRNVMAWICSASFVGGSLLWYVAAPIMLMCCVESAPTYWHYLLWLATTGGLFMYLEKH